MLRLINAMSPGLTLGPLFARSHTKPHGVPR